MLSSSLPTDRYYTILEGLFKRVVYIDGYQYIWSDEEYIIYSLSHKPLVVAVLVGGDLTLVMFPI